MCVLSEKCQQDFFVVYFLHRLFDCGITQEGGAHLISALISNPSHLRELDLGWNKIGDPGIKLISDFLKNELCKLEILK